MSNQTKTRFVRTLLQLIAGGALYGLTEQIAKDLPSEYAPYLILGYTLAVTLVQNIAEDLSGKDYVAGRGRVTKKNDVQ